LDDRTTPDSFNLTSKYTELVGKKGTYPIKYRVYHTLYSTNVVTLTDPFIITIIDPCDNPVSVTPSTLSAQEYTITQSSFSYEVPVYVSSPTWCAITYTYTIADAAGNTALTFDPTTRTFTFNQVNNLSLSGSTYKDYVVIVTG
jgi:hypothetical protein